MSEEQKKEIYTKMEDAVNEYLIDELIKKKNISIENVSLVFSYMNTNNLVKLSENLVKYSKDLVEQSGRLKFWTKVMAFTALGMIVLAGAQLVVLLRSIS